MYPRLTSSVQKLEIVKQFNSDWNILSAARGLVRCRLGDFASYSFLPYFKVGLGMARAKAGCGLHTEPGLPVVSSVNHNHILRPAPKSPSPSLFM
jgi:hypothetical protein